MVSCSGSLFQSCCGEEGALQTGIAGLCGEHSQCSGHTGFALSSLVCVLSPSTLLRLPAALYGAGPVLRVVPVFRYSTNARTRLHLRFVPSLVGAAQAARSLTGGLSPVRCAFSPPRPQPQFPSTPVGCMRLVFSCDPPGGCQPSRISGSLWLETGDLFAVW